MKRYHTIWSNLNFDYEDWRDFMDDEYPDLDESEKYEKAYEFNEEYLGDERCNLDVELDNIIIAIADLGLWDGAHKGYKEIGKNIKDCLYTDCEYADWVVNEYGDLICHAAHHDGCNRYRYRKFKTGVAEETISEFEDKLYTGRATEQEIEEVTEPLGKYIAEVYGWDDYRTEETA